MLKLVVRYTDEVELHRFIAVNSQIYSIKCKPHISKPVNKRPESGYYKREILLETPVIKPNKPCK